MPSHLPPFITTCHLYYRWLIRCILIRHKLCGNYIENIKSHCENFLPRLLYLLFYFQYSVSALLPNVPQDTSSMFVSYRVVLSLEASNYWRNAFKCAWIWKETISASIMSRSCFVSFPVCVYKFSSHYLNNIIFIDNSLGLVARESPCTKQPRKRMF
jgi:hypothetical protein